MISPELQIYIDATIVETVLADPRLTKQAQSGIVSSLLQKVFDYFHTKFSEVRDSNGKVEMITNFLVPGILTAFGFPVLGFLSKIGEVLFHFDYAKIFEEIGASVKSLVTGGKQTNSGEVDKVVSSVVNSNLPPEPTEDEMKKFVAAPIEKQQKLTLRDAQLFKLAMEDFAANNLDVDISNPDINIKFAAGWFSSALATFLSSRHKTTKILVSVLGWIVKAMLAAGGFMVMGDVVNKLLGKSNSIDGQQPNQPASETTIATTPAVQTTFKVSPTYVPENNNGPYARWMIQADPNQLDSMLAGWATEIYPEARGHESAIRASRTFNTLVSALKAYNAGGPPNTIFIPRQWKSRKQIVDQFMGEVSSASPTAPSTPAPAALIPNATPTTPEGGKGTYTL